MIEECNHDLFSFDYRITKKFEWDSMYACRKCGKTFKDIPSGAAIKNLTLDEGLKIETVFPTKKRS